MDGNLAMANQIVDTSENDMNEMHDMYCELEKLAKKDRKLKNRFRKELKGLINISGLFAFLEEHDTWEPIGIVEIYDINKKASGYPDTQCVKVKDEKENLTYLKFKESEIRNVDHYCVWQTSVGMSGDSYSGNLLFPLSNSKYFKVSYSC